MRTPSNAQRTLMLTLTLLMATAVGCESIMDEIDNAHEMVGIGDKQDEKLAAKAVADEPVKKGIDWSVSRSINTGQVDESIVRCKLGGASQFMRKDDCLTRGGTPGSV